MVFLEYMCTSMNIYCPLTAIKLKKCMRNFPMKLWNKSLVLYLFQSIFALFQSNNKSSNVGILYSDSNNIIIRFSKGTKQWVMIKKLLRTNTHTLSLKGRDR